MFSYLSSEDRVPADHPLRIIRDLIDPILERLSPQFAADVAPGGDKGYDREDPVEGLRSLNVTPHVAQNVHPTRAQSAIDGRTMRHVGHAVSQRKRKVVEETFGWFKVVGPLRKLHLRALSEWGFSSRLRWRPMIWSGCVR